MGFLSKKGQVEKLSGFALTLGVFAIILAVVFTILSNLETNSSLVSVGTKTDSNSVTTNNGTAATFSDVDSRGNAALSCSGVKIYNGTNVIDVTGYYTISGCSATLILANTTLNGAKQINYTMTYSEYSYGANSTQEMQSSLYGLVGWMPIVVVAFIGGLILFLVIKQFGDKQS